MRSVSALLVLGAVASAQQVPLADQVKGWIAKASSAVNAFGSAASASASAAASSIPNPVIAASSAVAASQVQPVTVANHKDLFVPGAATSSPGFEDWMVYVTGGNKSCHGLCARADREFNKSVPLLSALKGTPNLGRLDCDQEKVLCHAWSASPPSVLYFRVPQPLADQSSQATEVRYIYLNHTSVTATEFTALYTQGKYKNTPVYEGMWHPFDGALARNGLAIPLGYVFWTFGLVPSWMIMIAISMFSRTVLAKRMAPAPAAQPQQGAAPAGRPAAK
ncbi:hypothetical protein ANO11243_024840 [Dothideomycetidae sp. 11243]|nr:hypothetical protein ANO11243_024840 [fungal sp. No.11243]